MKMKIVRLDKRYTIDKAGFSAFMLAQGFHQQSVDGLIIHVRPDHPKGPTHLGEFKEPDTIYLYTHGQDPVEVNITLLHEVRHFWQWIEYFKKYHQAMSTKNPLLSWHLPSEEHIEYWNRPREVDARAFSEQYAAFHHFVFYHKMGDHR